MALVLVVLGLGAMVFGFFLVKRSRWLRYLPVIDLPLRPESKPAFLFIALLCGAMGMVLQMLASEEWTAVTKLFSNQFFIAIVLMSQEVYASKSNRSSSSSVLWVSVAAAVLIGMATGMVESAIIPLVLVAIVRWHVTRQIPWRLAFAGLVFFLVISPLKEEYRSRVWYGGGKDGFFDRVSGWLDVRKAAAEAEAPEIPWLLEEESWRRSVKRFDLLHRFAYVCGMTPEAVPFFNGATYEFLLYSLVPRVVWPNKPMATDATDLIDYAYKFRNEFEDKRSANISLGFLPESYANFGVWGVLFVMGLQGAIFALLDMVLNGRWSEGGRAIYLSIMVFFLNGIGTSTVILFGSLIQLTLASAVLMRPFALSFRAERREGER